MTNTRKALIVSPYLDHLGGGERYMLSAASALESLDYSVFFSWDNLAEIASLATMLGIKLNNPQLDPVIKKFYFGSNPLSMYLSTKNYDVVIYLSDGSLPLLGSRKNIIHMQVPFHHVSGRSWKNQFKKMFVHHVVVNSLFTKRIIDQEFGLSSTVLYPPVDGIVGTPQKDNLILSVGRFEPSLNTKHQDILIEAFKLLSPNLPGWKLVLAGGSSSDEWLTKLKNMAVDLPIEFAPNIAHADLSTLYSRAKIYWHAAGFGVDEQKNPELTEHFGISTVEAISAGCLPLVVPYGGQREIVVDTNLHWTTIEELNTKTLWLSQNPQVPSLDISLYSPANFATELKKLL
ncbi:MAG: glycosyltransferase family 4 protein [bacterium]